MMSTGGGAGVISVKAHPNFRGLEPLAAVGARRVRPGLIYRSGALRGLDADDIAIIDALHIAAVCDLRSAGERGHASNDWLAGRGVELAELDVLAAIPAEAGPWPLLKADRTPAGARAAMLTLYAAMPAAAGSHVVAIMRLVARGRVPLLVHCTAGKDRTGFVMAALLGALGVARTEVVADYMASAGRQNPAAFAATRRLAEERIGAPLDDATIDVLMGVEPAFIERSLATIDNEFGGIEPYLFDFGADADLLGRFRGRLLA